MFERGRGVGSAVAPAALLAGVAIGLFLFVYLLQSTRAVSRIDVLPPVSAPGSPSCPAPCFLFQVTNTGDAAGNFTCQLDPPGTFASSDRPVYMSPRPLQPNEGWALYASTFRPSKHGTEKPATEPVVHCFPT